MAGDGGVVCVAYITTTHPPYPGVMRQVPIQPGQHMGGQAVTVDKHTTPDRSRRSPLAVPGGGAGVVSTISSGWCKSAPAAWRLEVGR